MLGCRIPNTSDLGDIQLSWVKRENIAYIGSVQAARIMLKGSCPSEGNDLPPLLGY
jgi:hypothetical protein